MIDTPTPPDEAMELADRFLRAAAAVRDGDRDTARAHLSGPFQPDDRLALRDLFGLFSVAALLAGRALRKATADPDDPAPFDGPAALEILDPRSGLPKHPDDLPAVDRVAVWAAAAGANLDVDGIADHLAVLAGRGDDGRSIVQGLVMLTELCAACWDGGPLS